MQNGAQKYNGARSSLSAWFGTPQGAYALGWERAQFDSAVEDVFGFRAVQIGLPEVDFLQQNRIPFRFTLALEPGAVLAADALQLPLAAQSVDLVALPHVLEFHPNPHDVLREVEDVGWFPRSPSHRVWRRVRYGRWFPSRASQSTNQQNTYRV